MTNVYRLETTTEALKVITENGIPRFFIINEAESKSINPKNCFNLSEGIVSTSDVICFVADPSWAGDSTDEQIKTINRVLEAVGLPTRVFQIDYKEPFHRDFFGFAHLTQSYVVEQLVEIGYIKHKPLFEDEGEFDLDEDDEDGENWHRDVWLSHPTTTGLDCEVNEDGTMSFQLADQQLNLTNIDDVWSFPEIFPMILDLLKRCGSTFELKQTALTIYAIKQMASELLKLDYFKTDLRRFDGAITLSEDRTTVTIHLPHRNLQLDFKLDFGIIEVVTHRQRTSVHGFRTLIVYLLSKRFRDINNELAKDPELIEMISRLSIMLDQPLVVTKS